MNKKATGGSSFIVNGKSHYQRNRQKYIGKEIFRRKQAVDYIQSIKKNSKCTDCGMNDWRCLEFDHLPQYQKVVDIGSPRAQSWGRKRLDDEIAKCEIVCANCHKIRTFERRASLVLAAAHLASNQTGGVQIV